ncbi:6-phosphogluconolactonase [Altericista sp. CCNU0014]|uniref:6-phosphogluconolactonase n=1 Tax=Altericista sp. CCNU0014 TaxID=3082949 RepID=UPI00384F5A15
MEFSLKVLPDAMALVEHAESVIVAACQEAIAQQGRCTLALSGGSTPKPLYEKLAEQDLPWDKIHIFWGDERYVSPTHPDSNEGMARRAWLDRVPFPAENLHPMPTQAADPAESAQLYEAHLRAFFGEGDIPSFDLILLGLGDDGHTASLFPHTDVLNVCDRLIGVGYRDRDPRLTFTIPLINQARCVVFLVAGQSKRPALSAIFSDSANPFDYPARFIRPQGQLHWLLDKAAGDGLDPSSADRQL